MFCGGSSFANGGPARPAAGTPTLSVYRAARDGTWSPLGRVGALGGLLFAGLCPATPRHGLPPLHPAGIWSSLVFVRGALPLPPPTGRRFFERDTHPIKRRSLLAEHVVQSGFRSRCSFVDGQRRPTKPGKYQMKRR